MVTVMWRPDLGSPVQSQHLHSELRQELGEMDVISTLCCSQQSSNTDLRVLLETGRKSMCSSHLPMDLYCFSSLLLNKMCPLKFLQIKTQAPLSPLPLTVQRTAPVYYQQRNSISIRFLQRSAKLRVVKHFTLSGWI